MRSVEEQMKEILRRKEIYQAMKALRQRIVTEASVCGVCAVLMIAVVCFLPRVNQATGQATIGQYGSMILYMPTVGYIVVAILAFVLGCAVTLLCQHWKRKKEMEREL